MLKPWLQFYDAGVPAELTVPPFTVPDMLARAAQNHPHHTACVFMGARLTYRQLKQHVDMLAAGLHRLGVRRGDRVAIMLPNCPQTVMAYYAVLSLGAVAVMTNPLYVARELEYQWQNAGVKVVIGLDLFWPRFEAVRPRLFLEHIILTGIQDFMPAPKKWLTPLVLRRRGKWVNVPYGGPVRKLAAVLKMASEPPPVVNLHPTDLACLQYTGGTTGLPKGAMLTHRNLVASVAQIRAFLLVGHQDAQDTVLGIMPFFHVYGMNGLMNLGVHLAATLVLIPQPEVKPIIDAIVAERPTFFTGVPALFVALNNYRGIDQVDLSSIKAMFSGAAPLPVEVMEKFEARTGARIAEAYGMTEASSVTHVNPRHGQRKFGSVGLPIIGTEARIVDVDNPARDLSAGEVGELLVKGPQVMQGYWHAPEETAAALLDGWLRTGDMARMDDDGYFYIVDRKKDLILSAGFNVYPREVEEVLYQHPKVLEAAVIGLPNGLRGEKIAAYVTLKPGQTATPAEIRTFCRERLAPYKQPRTVVFRDNLPKSMAGKVLRRQLREEEQAASKDPGS
jgi:long-chain acyl-CoA synthetase